MTMPALVYIGPNALRFDPATPVPVPGPGEVLVQVVSVGVCGSDMHAYHGHDSRRPAPLILGHEAAGHVQGGPRDGQRVTINPLVTDPDGPEARAGRAHLSPGRQIISMPPRPGAFAGFVTIPERNLHQVPDALTLDQAALCEPVAVSWHAVKQGLRLLAEAPALTMVQGGGAIGLAAALCARHLAGGRVVVVEPNAARRALIAAQGIEGLAPQDAGSLTPDLVIDAVGAVATRIAASAQVRPGGVIVHVGLLPGVEGFDIRRITLQEIVVSGSYCYTPQDFADTLAAMAQGVLGRLDWFETRPLAQGAQGFADLDAGRIAAPKLVLKP